MMPSKGQGNSNANANAFQSHTVLLLLLFLLLFLVFKTINNIFLYSIKLQGMDVELYVHE